MLIARKAHLRCITQKGIQTQSNSYAQNRVQVASPILEAPKSRMKEEERQAIFSIRTKLLFTQACWMPNSTQGLYDEVEGEEAEQDTKYR